MFTYNSTIKLIQPVIDAEGTETEQVVKVYAAVSSVGYNEFYRATQTGFSPEIKFTLPDFRYYAMQPIIEYNGTRYNVIRSYKVGQQELEITCERVNSNGAV